jgi:hypothetical protein
MMLFTQNVNNCFKNVKIIKLNFHILILNLHSLT